MGTKGGKPITAIEKRQKRLREKQMRITSSEKSEERLVYYNEAILKAAIKEIKSLNYVTPYMLMNKLNVTYGVAKDILEELEKKGIVKLYSRNRRVLIYVPVAAK